MSHIHIPDGVLSADWWLAGYILTAFFLLVSVKRLEGKDVRSKVPYLGVVGALMLITMSIPLGVIPFHINLTVLVGILAGPSLGFLAVFIVNLFLSFLGHGGITVVGINTMILGSEIFLGYYLFKGLRRLFKDKMAVGMTTVVTLLISSVLMLGVVGISQVGWEYALPHDHQEHDHQHKEVEETHVDEDSHVETGNFEEKEPVQADGEEVQFVGLLTSLSEISILNISGVGAALFILLIGIGLETLITVLLINFFKRVRPDMID